MCVARPDVSQRLMTPFEENSLGVMGGRLVTTTVAKPEVSQGDVAALGRSRTPASPVDFESSGQPSVGMSRTVWTAPSLRNPQLPSHRRRTTTSSKSVARLAYSAGSNEIVSTMPAVAAHRRDLAARPPIQSRAHRWRDQSASVDEAVRSGASAPGARESRLRSGK